jgi:hypothetical protein
VNAWFDWKQSRYIQLLASDLDTGAIQTRTGPDSRFFVGRAVSFVQPPTGTRDNVTHCDSTDPGDTHSPLQQAA